MTEPENGNGPYQKIIMRDNWVKYIYKQWEKQKQKTHDKNEYYNMKQWIINHIEVDIEYLIHNYQQRHSQAK